MLEKNKQDAIKKLLNLTDEQFDELQNKVLDDWAANVISTNYQASKTIEEMTTDINATKVTIKQTIGSVKKNNK
jgi:uncharacterized protein YfdQ (DUF2303 family)